jgi:hypothetical protein
VNRKEQVCFSFLLYGVEQYTVKRYFSVIKEREESGFLLFPRGSGKAKEEDDKKKIPRTIKKAPQQNQEDFV